MALTIIHLSGDDGPWALASMLCNIKYTGLCFTQDHCDLLQDHLARQLVEHMVSAATPNLYNQAFAEMIGHAETSVTTPKARGTPPNASGTPKTGGTPPKAGTATPNTGGTTPKTGGTPPKAGTTTPNICTDLLIVVL